MGVCLMGVSEIVIVAILLGRPKKPGVAMWLCKTSCDESVRFRKLRLCLGWTCGFAGGTRLLKVSADGAWYRVIDSPFQVTVQDRTIRVRS